MPTRASRKIAVTGPHGHLVHEIRLSMHDGRWQARVVTLPNHIWVEPGGRRALVFESEYADKAEAMAAAFVQRDCLARGHRVVDPLRIDDRQTKPEPARRRLAHYPIRLVSRAQGGTGADRRTLTATSENLSETGLFIVTDDPPPPRSRVDIDLRLPGLAERLEGVVVWVRKESGPGREMGMGVRLLDPPLAYRALLQTLG